VLQLVYQQRGALTTAIIQYSPAHCDYSVHITARVRTSATVKTIRDHSSLSQRRDRNVLIYALLLILQCHEITVSFVSTSDSTMATYIIIIYITYITFNCIFGKVGRVASENVVIELLKAKCLPSLYYVLEACPINKSHIRLLEFVINSSFRKIFSTKSYDVANKCARFFQLFCLMRSIKKKDEVFNIVKNFRKHNMQTVC